MAEITIDEIRARLDELSGKKPAQKDIQVSDVEVESVIPPGERAMPPREEHEEYEPADTHTAVTSSLVSHGDAVADWRGTDSVEDCSDMPAAPPSEDEVSDGSFTDLPDYFYEEIDHATGEVSDPRDGIAGASPETPSLVPSHSSPAESGYPTGKIKRFAVPVAVAVGVLGLGGYMLLYSSGLSPAPKKEQKLSALQMMAPPIQAVASSAVMKQISSARPVMPNLSGARRPAQENVKVVPAVVQEKVVKPAAVIAIGEENAEQKPVMAKRVYRSEKHRREGKPLGAVLPANKYPKRDALAKTEKTTRVEKAENSAMESVLGDLVKARNIQ